MPRSSATVKSERPWRPGGCSCEEYLTLTAILNAPLTKPPLQRSQDARTIICRVSALQLFEQRCGVQVRSGDEQRHEVSRPDLAQRIDAGAPVPRRALRRQPRGLLDPASTALADRNFRRRCRTRHGAADVLDKFRLYSSTWKSVILLPGMAQNFGLRRRSGFRFLRLPVQAFQLAKIVVGTWPG